MVLVVYALEISGYSLDKLLGKSAPDGGAGEVLQEVEEAKLKWADRVFQGGRME